MGRIWYCGQCGYEVNGRGRCHNCHQPLTASPMLELSPSEVIEEVGYSLEDWEDSARGELIGHLVTRELRHRFEGDELVVAAADEEAVDTLMAELSSENEALLAGQPDLAAGAALRPVYSAAVRLLADPTDMHADSDLAEAAAGVFAIEEVRGVGEEDWAAIGRVTRRLLAALGADEALEDEIATSAQLLCKLLEGIQVQVGGLGAEGGEAAGMEPADETPSPAGEGDAGAAATPADEAPEGPGESAEGAIDATDPADPDAGAPVSEAAPAPVDADASPEADAVTEAEEDDPTFVPLVVPEVAADTPDEPDDPDEPDEMVYELDDWRPEERAQVSMILDREHITYGWEATDLVVRAADDEQVERLLAEIERVPAGAGDPDGGDDIDDEAVYHVLSELFGAAARLAGDPDNRQKRQDLTAAAEVIKDASTPFAMTDDQWWRIKLRARDLAASIGLDASPAVIEDSATSLRELLRDFV